MRRWILFVLLAGLLTVSCSPNEPSDWRELIPDRTPFLLLPDEGETLEGLLGSPYIPLLDDLSPAAFHLAGQISDHSDSELPLAALLLYPDTSNDWHPVWITRTQAGFVETLTGLYHRPFTQNNYRFNRYKIEILSISNRSLYLAELGPYTIISESSRGVEDIIRTFSGELKPMELKNADTSPGSLIVNTPSLEYWIAQLAQVTYRPYLYDLFKGSGPMTLRSPIGFTDDTDEEAVVHAGIGGASPTGQENLLWKLQGEFHLQEDFSSLLHSVSYPARSINLDRYLSTQIAAVSIFHLEPAQSTDPDIEPESELDHYLMEEVSLFRDIASTLSSETAYAAYAESGFMSSSEFLFLRRLDNPSQLQGLLDRLTEEELILEEGGIWHVNSRLFGNLLGTQLAPFTSFYIGIRGEAAALSRSRSLIERSETDFMRRNVLYYDESYQAIRGSFPEQVSSFTLVNVPEFNSYVQPWLDPMNNFGALGSQLDVLTITTGRESEDAPLQIDISSFERETIEEPYRDRWIFTVSDRLTGPPALANITGNSRDELIFATESGSIYVVAADGSEVMHTSTVPDRPVGPPVIYDWYGNNQHVIMQAAGERIYAWNEAGSLLPNFPVEMDEAVTSPLQVMDVTRNGMAEMIVTTADRQVHILDHRGENISGWPQTANSVIRSKPQFEQFGQQRALLAFSQNALHVWNLSGSLRDGFPIFIEAEFNGSPILHGEHILGSGSDGRLYAIGTEPLFDPNLAASSDNDSLLVQSLEVSNRSLNRPPSIYNRMIRVDEELVREDLILTQAENGSVQAFSSSGELRFSQSMGQNASDSASPMILDLNGNNRQDVVALSEPGRLFAWDLINGERLEELPASGMQYPLYIDLNNDGNIEIIAQTREGLRVWSIFH